MSFRRIPRITMSKHFKSRTSKRRLTSSGEILRPQFLTLGRRRYVTCPSGVSSGRQTPCVSTIAKCFVPIRRQYTSYPGSTQLLIRNSLEVSTIKHFLQPSSAGKRSVPARRPPLTLMERREGQPSPRTGGARLGQPGGKAGQRGASSPDRRGFVESKQQLR